MGTLEENQRLADLEGRKGNYPDGNFDNIENKGFAVPKPGVLKKEFQPGNLVESDSGSEIIGKGLGTDSPELQQSLQVESGKVSGVTAKEISDVLSDSGSNQDLIPRIEKLGSASKALEYLLNLRNSKN